MEFVSEREHVGRRLEYYRHTCGKEYGYPSEREDGFAVLHPKEEKDGAEYPFFVVFHSAGHDLESTLQCMVTPGDHDIYHTPDGCYALILDCRAHHKDDWWWGGRDALSYGYGHDDRDGIELTPVEKRVLDEIDWVIENYPIDRERIYAVGNSMGGSGALGIALRRGDLFAAIKANVPAGVRHAADRCRLDKPYPEGFSIPDPPIVIDYSAQNDGWSQGHEVLYRGAREKKYPLIGFFGAFGHENDDSKINAVNDLVHAFDIGTVRLHEAYPIFTNASTDDPIPWPEHLDSTLSGQVNAFFRWKIIEDSDDCFKIELRLLTPDEWKTRIKLPESSTADLSFRRLQSFRLEPNASFECSYGGQTLQGATDGSGVPTVPSVTVKQTPAILVINK